MRVTNNLVFNSMINDISRTNEDILKTQETLASGKKVNKPSDDPVAMTSIISYQKLLARVEQYSRNVQSAQAYLTNADSALSSAETAVSRLSELATSQSSGTATAATRLSAASEVEGLYDELISLANTSVGGRYIFSGYKFTTEPFAPGGAYSGDNNETALFIGESNQYTYGITGNKVFKGVGISGGVDVFNIVQGFKTALETNDVTGIQNAIDTLDDANTQIVNMNVQIGARGNTLTSQKNWLDSFTTELNILVSNIEDADITKVATELVLEQTTLQALLAITARIDDLNIFKFI
ncbi:MAG: flagellar hook-associated protein FlgL [Deltaproteobacteria bacterium]|nr:flagellar hook-associated protein FlgL [Deltaproteobacteria bacterium]